MDNLYKIFGPPHELLHVLALILIGRRPKAISYKHVDIPDDLSTRAYVFAAGLPALIFWGAAVIGGLKLGTSTSFSEAVTAFVIFSVFVMAGLGTIGDLQLIIRRLKL